MSARLRNRGRKDHAARARPGLEALEARLAPSADVLGARGLLDPAHGVLPPLDFTPALTAGSTTTTTTAGTAGASPAVPAYSSLPGAKATIYLDFGGDFEARWGSFSNVSTPAFDTDGNPGSFSASELTAIHDIWAYVAEDYSPFNVNVTTVAPAGFADGVALKVVIGGDGSWTGGTYGGVSYVGAFTNSAPNVSFVFPANLANTARYVADAAAHEAGHEFGLEHQAQYTGGTLTNEYNPGPGDGTAPLMGSSYSAARSLWWYGTSDVSATTYQNDMDVIASAANGFGYRTDDHGDTPATATPLTVSPTGAVSASGVIEKMSDLDYFSFSTAAGTVTLTVSVPGPYNNLDPRLEVRDAGGNLVASADPAGSYSASVSFTAGAGTYYLVVASHGPSANATPTNYGFDVGQYTVSGAVVPAGVSAPAAPSNLSASAVSSSAITLTWADNSANEDGFKVERLDGSGAWVQVAAVGANVTSWQDPGLVAGTTYTYRVRAYNAGGDSAPSNTASATTNPSTSVPGAPANLTASVRTRLRTRVVLTWSDTSNNEAGFSVERSSDGGSTWVRIARLAANSTAYSDGGVPAGVTYLYRVFAFNAAGPSAASNVVTVSLGGARHALAGALATGGAELPAGSLADVIGRLNALSERIGKLAGVADRVTELPAPGGSGTPAARPMAESHAGAGVRAGTHRGVRGASDDALRQDLGAPDFNPLGVVV